MATFKETRITDIRVEVSIGDIDRTDVKATVSALTRTNEGVSVYSYREDITSMISDETRALLAPLFDLIVGRVMTDRDITAEDLAEGLAYVTANGPQPMQAAVRAASDEAEVPEPVEPDSGARLAREESERANAEAEAEHARLIEQGERYRREVEKQAETIRREAAELRRRQAQANEPRRKN